jgi:hypothetical protein
LLTALPLVWLLNAAAPAMAGVGMPEIGSLQIGPYRAHLLNDSAGLRRGTNTLTVHIPDLPVGAAVTLRLHGPGGEAVDVPLRPLRVWTGPERGHGVATASPPPGATATAGHANARPPEAGAGSETHAGHRGQAARGETPVAEAAPAPHAHGQPSQASDAGAGNAAGAHASDEATHTATAAGAETSGGHAAEAHGVGVLSGFAARGTGRLPATGAWRAVLAAGDAQATSETGELTLTVAADGPNLLFLGFLGALSGGSVLYGWTHRRRVPPARN